MKLLEGRLMMAERPPDSGPGGAVPVSGKRRLTSTELFAGTHEVVIVHGGEEYRLRITKNDKLILTK